MAHQVHRRITPPPLPPPPPPALTLQSGIIIKVYNIKIKLINDHIKKCWLSISKPSHEIKVTRGRQQQKSKHFLLLQTDQNPRLIITKPQHFYQIQDGVPCSLRKYCTLGVLENIREHRRLFGLKCLVKKQ